MYQVCLYFIIGALVQRAKLRWLFCEDLERNVRHLTGQKPFSTSLKTYSFCRMVAILFQRKYLRKANLAAFSAE